MLKKIGLGIVLAVIVFVVIVSLKQKSYLKSFEYLKEPRIISLPDQKMLVVEIKGNPNIKGKEAFALLYKALYTLKKTYKEIDMVAPRTRWPKPFDTPIEEWIGLYGVPIPDIVEKLPEEEMKDYKIKIDTWKYGEVAEILHIGEYNDEIPTIEKLKEFVKSKGYKIIGAHEENYIKGPGMFFKGNPKNYYTLIRYKIQRI